MSDSILTKDRQRVIEIGQQISALRMERENLLRGLRGTCVHAHVVLVEPHTCYCLDCGDREVAASALALGGEKGATDFFIMTAKPLATCKNSDLGRFEDRLYRDGCFNEFDALILTAT